MKKKSKIAITQAEVDEFAVIRARMLVDKNRRVELRSKFIEAKLEGTKFPTRGPHLIRFIPKGKLDIDWEEEALILARVLFGSLETAEQHIAEIKATADIKPYVEVTTMANPNWIAKPKLVISRKRRLG